MYLDEVLLILYDGSDNLSLNTEMGKVLEQKPVLVTVIIPFFGHLIYTTDKKLSKEVSDVP